MSYTLSYIILANPHQIVMWDVYNFHFVEKESDDT